MASILIDMPDKEECANYLRKEGIFEYFAEIESKPYGIFDAVDSQNDIPFYPEPEDLYRLHKLVRERKVFNVLEFGLGYSTIVMADALMKNKNDYVCGGSKPDVRIRKPFTLYSVDANKYWIDRFSKLYRNLPLFNCIELSHSDCIIGEHNDQICHFYSAIPDVIADFIYLDGPGRGDVKGSINGVSFENCIERPVAGGDLLKLESTFLPGTFILIDGRTNNARFLQNNFKRNYQIIHDENQDVTAIELTEPPLGKINRAQIEYSLGKDYFDRLNKI